jgi:hypothetical protein
MRFMMIVFFVGLLTGSDIIVASAQMEQQEWPFSKAIELQGSGPYHALFLDEEVYGGTREDLGDLRIVNQSGNYVPFYMDHGYGEAKEQSKTYSSSLVRSAIKKGNTLLDYKITPMSENVDIQGNILAIELPEVDFLKHIDVYGSYDGNQWEFIDQSDLYRTDQLVKSSIELGSEHKFEFYRLSVLNNVEKLKFPSLQLIHNTEELQWLDYKKLGDPSYEVKQVDGVTEIIVNNESRLRINKMQLLTEGSNFTRSVELYDDQGVNIRTVGEQDLFRLDFKDVQIMNNAITTPIPNSSPSFTIRINNRDDSPLNIVDVHTEYIVDKLVFEDTDEGPYKLLYGNPNAIQPQYDIVNFKTHIEQEEVALGKLGTQVSLQEGFSKEEPTAWWQQQKVWFNGIIIFVSILLVGLLIKKMNIPK